MRKVVYLYGFVPAGTPPPPGIAGIADEEVEIVELGPFDAAISRVPADAYGPEAVRRRLTDLDWVSQQGLRHEGVVNRFVDQGTIIPARLLTLFSSTEKLSMDAVTHQERIRGELRRFTGCREWDLKVSYDAGRLRPHLSTISDGVASLEERISEAAPGTRYLLERKRSRMLHEAAASAARQLAEELLTALERSAVETRRLEAPPEAADLPVVLYAALLVKESRDEAIRAAAADEKARLEGIGLRVSFTGPWAPYRFLERSDDDGPDIAGAG